MIKAFYLQFMGYMIHWREKNKKELILIMKKRVFYILNIFLILSFQLLDLNFIENKKIEEIFEKNKLEGTFVLQ